MKRFITAVCLVLFLAGCSGADDTLDRAMALRSRLLAAQGIQFETEITADYGDSTYTFSMTCASDAQGNVHFTVAQPESIAGITGTVSAEGGKLTFDDKALSFELMADGQVTPVSAPWLLVKTLRSGYLTSCCREGDYLRLAIDDSYAEDALHLDIWLGESDLPVQADILWQGRRLLSIRVKNFTFL